MWLDRSFIKLPNQKEGHIGELWMVHGGGFYRVEKLQMGPTKVPKVLHWFKWESYWTWTSGMLLLMLIFYTGGGTFLLDESVSNISFTQGMLLALFSVFGSWFVYDFVWDSKLIKKSSLYGHLFTLIWLIGMTYFLCQTLSGRAAYIHVGAMIGTWMVGNVYLRIIPRQLKMVESSKSGEKINQEWATNAKNRSTHNTYLTLPIIFIMLSNHFPSTYGHELNWLILFLISLAGAFIRQYFVIRLAKPTRSKQYAVFGLLILFGVSFMTREPGEAIEPPKEEILITVKAETPKEENMPVDMSKTVNIRGIITFEGKIPKGKKLRLPRACAKQHKGDVYSNEVQVNNGKLKNVFVRISKGLEGRTFSTVPDVEVVVDQKGCIYVPRVSAARVGQSVTFVNSDPVFHNVRSKTKKNKRFNIAMPKKNQRKTRVFKKPEILLQTKCSVHPWMSTYIAVVEHPYFDITKEKGKFILKDVPLGSYTIETWHEKFGIQTHQLEITDESDINLKFIYKN